MNACARLKNYIRCRYYRSLSSKKVRISGKPCINQALLIEGDGEIRFAKNVHLGYKQSAGFYSQYMYMDVRGQRSVIQIGEGAILNNNINLSADHASIYIGDRTVCGINLSVHTSDGHGLSPGKRHEGLYPCLSVYIGENVFIGDDVIVLKGSSIGRNSVIGAGSVVSGNIPENVVAAGNPCKVLRRL